MDQRGRTLARAHIIWLRSVRAMHCSFNKGLFKRNLPEGANIGSKVNDAMRAIERGNPQLASRRAPENLRALRARYPRG